MDPQVLAAMAKWPNVPAVYGWLSLSESGHWRLHAAGAAHTQPDTPGEPITSPQILAFIDRNYDVDAKGQWYFQNGPQRVYVRLDAAPFVLHFTNDADNGALILRTHTGLNIRRIHALHVDDTGRVYADTDRGPALIAGRDLPLLFDALDPESGDTKIEDAIAQCMQTGEVVRLRPARVSSLPQNSIPLHCTRAGSLEETLKFRRLPLPDTAA